ncbi:MAG: PSP1 domain-containing protein, partial [Desulfobulbaceae bacterium]|nr:PSP1 domain-containing protein [Desulfobulbaceae bacterium]
MSETIDTVLDEGAKAELVPTDQLKLYHVRFRDGLQPKAASSKLLGLVRGDAVMVQTDHGPEPAHVCGSGIELAPLEIDKPLQVLTILRRTSSDEIARYQNLLQREQDARRYCQGLIQNLNLGMKLLQVERYFNGSKVIFYFSAETRVDFRDLVKSLVQEFRTRVEMRQIGVRHETQMLGGLGCCGRELCCGLFMKEFVP